MGGDDHANRIRPLPVTARLDPSQIPEPAKAEVPLENDMHITAPLVMNQRLINIIVSNFSKRWKLQCFIILESVHVLSES